MVDTGKMYLKDFQVVVDMAVVGIGGRNRMGSIERLVGRRSFGGNNKGNSLKKQLAYEPLIKISGHSLNLS